MTRVQCLALLGGVLILWFSTLLDHPEQLALIGVYLCVMVAGLVRTCGFWDCRTLFFAVSTAYVLAGPVDVLLVADPSDLDADATFLALRYGFIFLLSSLLLMLTSREQLSQCGSTISLPCDWELAALLLAFSVAAYLYGVETGPGFAIGDLSRAEVGLSQGWFLAVTRFFVYVQLLYVAIALRHSEVTAVRRSLLAKMIILAALACFFATELLVLGDRRMLVMMSIGICIALFGNQSPVMPLLVTAVLAPALILYPMVRNSPIELWWDVVSYTDLSLALAPRNLEFGAFALVADTLITDPPHDFPSYVQTLPQLFPRFLFEGRPDAPSQWFVQTYFPEVALVGGGLAFNFVMEAFLNGGMAALFFMGALIGLCLRFASVGQYRRVLNPIFGAALVFLMRLDFVSLLRNLFIIAVMFAAVWLAQRWLSQLGRRATGVPPLNGVA